jgi:hypothetical protein
MAHVLGWLDGMKITPDTTGLWIPSQQVFEANQEDKRIIKFYRGSPLIHYGLLEQERQVHCASLANSYIHRMIEWAQSAENQI